MQYSPRLPQWLVPLREGQRTLAEAYASLQAIGNTAKEVPLMVQMAENPRFAFRGLGYFKGRVSLLQHDYIHIVLGRGATPIDEAFVLGFTMGSTDQVSTPEAHLFGFISSVLYPPPYRFNPREVQVFKDAVALGYISDCRPLDQVDFRPMLDWALCRVRAAIGLESDLLEAYYRIEAHRYPDSAASRRLVEPVL